MSLKLDGVIDVYINCRKQETKEFNPLCAVPHIRGTHGLLAGCQMICTVCGICATPGNLCNKRKEGGGGGGGGLKYTLQKRALTLLCIERFL